jgi:putative flippase GtrA
LAVLENRAIQALRSPHNWVQLAKFGVVGLSGYVIYLAIYAALLGIGAHLAAAIAFVVSAANNYWWNRHWTFVQTKGHFGHQGVRFFIVSTIAFGANQFWLYIFLDLLGWGKIVAAAVAVVCITPLNFIGNKLWSFRR